MGYKILDVKADIHEDVEKYFRRAIADAKHLSANGTRLVELLETVRDSMLDIVDENFEKIER
jgi:hypothetical protein